jgi:hypothetical protein
VLPKDEGAVKTATFERSRVGSAWPYPPKMGQRPAAGDLALAGALTALTLGNLWASGWTPTPMGLLYWLAALTATSSVLWRRTHPVVSAVVTYVLLSALTLADQTDELWI